MPRGNTQYLTSRVAGKPAALNEVVVNGAGANTNIPVTGIKTTDLLVSVLEYRSPATAGGAGVKPVVDRTSATSITSAGNIQVTAATNGDVDNVLVVKYYSV